MDWLDFSNIAKQILYKKYNIFQLISNIYLLLGIDYSLTSVCMTCLEVPITIPEVYVKMSRDNIKTTILIYSIFFKDHNKMHLNHFSMLHWTCFFLLCHLKQHVVVIGNFKQVIIVCFLEINFHLFWRYNFVEV